METDSSFSIILSLISEGNKLECGKRQQFIIYISAGILEIEVIEIETHWYERKSCKNLCGSDLKTEKMKVWTCFY